MTCNRTTAWRLFLIVGGLAAASAGCGRPAVAPPPDGLAAAEPARHESSESSDPKKDGDGSPFKFPDDAGGAILAKVLPPSDVKGPLNEPDHGPRRVPTPGLEPPLLPLPPSQAPPPPPPAERTRQPLAPRLVIEETLGLDRGDPEPPAPRSFFVLDRPRLPSVDVNQPIPLPILAQPTPDRASLDDPTGDASTAAVLSAPTPQRTNPVAYFRLTLPDPYDNRRPLRLPVPAEESSPHTGTVHPPKP